MSNAAKLSLIILIILVIGSFGLAGYVLLEKQKIEQEKTRLHGEVQSAQSREQKYILDKKNIEEQLKKVEEEKVKLEQELSGVDEKVKKFNEEIARLTQERNQWKTRVESIQKERDDLATQLKGISLAAPPPPSASVSAARGEEDLEKEVSRPSVAVPDQETDNYWASVLKEKASLKVQLEGLNQEVSTTAVEIGELKKQNNDLQMEINRLKNEKTAIEREIKHGKDMADTLSLELARAKSDNQFMSDRYEKIKGENEKLQTQIKELTATKVALEKNIVRITEDKNNLQKKLLETEHVIQSKIAEIWEMRQGIDQKLKESAAEATEEIELPPIVVNPRGGARALEGEPILEPEGSAAWEREAAAQESLKTQGAGFNGTIISVNEDNNFVIVDIGEKKGVRPGTQLNVYRRDDFIAQLEVIQVRADICAADIKEKRTQIKVDDNVR